MAHHLPTPLAAALGIVPATLEQVLRLPGRAVHLPVLALSSALATFGALRTGYGDLAARGDHLVARLSGSAGAAVDAADELEDRVEDLVGRTPFATAYDRAEDALEGAASATGRAVAQVSPLTERVRSAAAGTATAAADAVDTVAGTVEQAADTVAGTVEQATDTVAGTVEQAADTVGTVEQDTDAAPARSGAQAPKGAPTPRAVEPDTTRIDTAASPSVQQAVEQAAARVPSGPPVDHDALPLADYDHMTLGSLRGRLRALSVEELVQVRTYEKAHADRLPVVTMLDNRIAKLATDPAATPSGPVSTRPAPEQLAASAAPSAPGVSPATTDAPPVNPPSQGVPTNPAQPR